VQQSRLDAINWQAKRWGGAVGAAEVCDFKEALDAKGTHKRICITTSSLTDLQPFRLQFKAVPTKLSSSTAFFADD
jgi:restriction endonuclease Mrr